MEAHGLAGKMIAKMPKIARDCESPVSLWPVHDTRISPRLSPIAMSHRPSKSQLFSIEMTFACDC